jgi:3-phenylpropionate/trans-cinnamate dioxygenase ferredoxin reductase subunit
MALRRFDYCVIGAGIAGTTAVETLRDGDRVADIALITDESHLMYYRPRLPGYVGGHVRLENIVERDPARARGRRIDLFQPAQVMALDPEQQIITLADDRTLGYRKLLVATGARPKRLGVPGEDLAGVTPLWSLADAERIRTALPAVRRAVVIGGGFIAAELIEAFRLNGIQVTYLVRGPRWFYPFTDAAAGRMVAEELRAHGVDARFNAGVDAITGDGDRATGVRLEDGSEIRAGLVTTSLGARWEMG